MSPFGTAGKLLADICDVHALWRIPTCWLSSIKTGIVSPSVMPITLAE
jgi:hypothetical protein